jgi:hypothetical protein
MLSLLLELNRVKFTIFSLMNSNPYNQTNFSCCCCIYCGIKCTCPKCSSIHCNQSGELQKCWEFIVDDAGSRFNLFQSNSTQKTKAEAKKRFIRFVFLY